MLEVTFIPNKLHLIILVQNFVTFVSVTLYSVGLYPGC